MTPLDRPRGFSIRTFAGPLVHTEQLGHVRVAHLTDLHVGRVTPMRIQWKAVELTNHARPDLVVITGDFVAHSQAYLEELRAVVAALHAPVVCVLGNHDHWVGSDAVRGALRRAGAEVLDNQHTVLSVGGEQLQIVGLDDAYTGHADVDRAVRGMRPDLPTIGLSHIAEEADRLWAAGVPLVLSGHTHAGQVTVARMHELLLGKVAGHRYLHGLYGSRQRGIGGGAVYVGAGVGAAVIPLRIGERSRRELAIFELGRSPGDLVEPLTEQRPHVGREPSLRAQYRRAASVVKKEQRRARRRDRRPWLG